MIARGAAFAALTLSHVFCAGLRARVGYNNFTRAPVSRTFTHISCRISISRNYVPRIFLHYAYIRDSLYATVARAVDTRERHPRLRSIRPAGIFVGRRRGVLARRYRRGPFRFDFDGASRARRMFSRSADRLTSSRALPLPHTLPSNHAHPPHSLSLPSPTEG